MLRKTNQTPFLRVHSRRSFISLLRVKQNKLFSIRYMCALERQTSHITSLFIICCFVIWREEPWLNHGPSSLQLCLRKDVLDNRLFWHPPDSSVPEPFQFTVFQDLIDSIHPNPKSLRSFCRCQDVIILLKHNTSPSFCHSGDTSVPNTGGSCTCASSFHRYDDHRKASAYS